MSRVSAEKVLAAAVAKSDQLGVKVILALGTKISNVQMSVNFEPKPIMLCSDEHLCDGQMFINIHFNLHYVMFR